MATVKQRKGASRVASSKGGAAVAELMLELSLIHI